MDIITSSQNEQFKLLKSLLTSKGVKKHRLCLAMGRKFIPTKDKIELQVFAKNHATDITSQTKIRQLILNNELFKQIDVLGTNWPISVIKTLSLPTWDEQDKLEGKEILIQFKDPANLGSVIRSCVAFDVDKIILLNGAVNPFLPKVIKSSNYAVFSRKLFLGPCVESLRQYMALDSNKGTDINKFKWPEKGRLLIGEERGLVVNKKAQVKHIHIPMAKGFDSLNSSVAASIAIHAWRMWPR